MLNLLKSDYSKLSRLRSLKYDTAVLNIASSINSLKMFVDVFTDK